jgi:DNA-binding response OmpR family regulator
LWRRPLGLETVRPDTLVLDIGMPKLNGFDVLARLRTPDQQPTVILLSAQADRPAV